MRDITLGMQGLVDTLLSLSLDMIQQYEGITIPNLLLNI